LSAFTGTSLVTFGTSYGSPIGSNNPRRYIFSLNVKSEATVQKLLQLVHQSRHQYSERQYIECFQIDWVPASVADCDFNTEIVFNQPAGNDISPKVRVNITVLLEYLTYFFVF
jgi:hypothetical protein